MIKMVTYLYLPPLPQQKRKTIQISLYQLKCELRPPDHSVPSSAKMPTFAEDSFTVL